LRGVSFAPPPPPAGEKPKPAGRAKKPKRKNDPTHVAAARELRDRYLEHLAANPSAELLPARGKYDVSRALESALGDQQSAIASPAIRSLPAAA
jgi:hypothetical protein